MKTLLKVFDQGFGYHKLDEDTFEGFRTRIRSSSTSGDFLKDIHKKRRLHIQTSLRIEARNHTPHSALLKGMFLGLHNSAHRSINITHN
jgi:hypothetical protein